MARHRKSTAQKEAAPATGSATTPPSAETLQRLLHGQQFQQATGTQAMYQVSAVQMGGRQEPLVTDATAQPIAHPAQAAYAATMPSGHVHPAVATNQVAILVSPATYLAVSGNPVAVAQQGTTPWVLADAHPATVHGAGNAAPRGRKASASSSEDVTMLAQTAQSPVLAAAAALKSQAQVPPSPGSVVPSQQGSATNPSQHTQESAPKRRRKSASDRRGSASSKRIDDKADSEMSYRYSEEISAIATVLGIRLAGPKVIKIVEDIVLQQLRELVVLCADASRLRGARGLSVDDLQYVCRTNKPFAFRLASFIAEKEAKKRGPGAWPKYGDGHRHIAHHVLGSLNVWTPECPVQPTSSSFLTRVTEYERREEAATKGLEANEQVAYADARKNTSFTVKKAKRFREWLCVTLSTDFKGNDDFYDTLGHAGNMITSDLLLHAERVRTASDMHVEVADIVEALRRLGSIPASIARAAT